MIIKKAKNEQPEPAARNEKLQVTIPAKQRHPQMVTQPNNVIEIVTRINSSVLSYSITEDNGYLLLIRDSVSEGMPPIVSQESVIRFVEMSGLVHRLEAGKEELPSDYAPAGHETFNEDTTDVEVDIDG